MGMMAAAWFDDRALCDICSIISNAHLLPEPERAKSSSSLKSTLDEDDSVRNAQG